MPGLIIFLIALVIITLVVFLLVSEVLKLRPVSNKRLIKEREVHNKIPLQIINSKEFSEYKYLEGYVVSGFINTFCMLSENGQFFFYPNKISFDIKEVISLEVTVDGTVSNGLKGAVAGGLLFGGIGALTGYFATKSNSVKQIGLEFSIDNFNYPNYTFMFFDSPDKFSIKHEEVVAAKKRLHNFLSHLLIIDKRHNESILFRDKPFIEDNKKNINI